MLIHIEHDIGHFFFFFTGKNRIIIIKSTISCLNCEKKCLKKKRDEHFHAHFVECVYTPLRKDGGAVLSVMTSSTCYSHFVLFLFNSRQWDIENDCAKIVHVFIDIDGKLRHHLNLADCLMKNRGRFFN